MRKFTLAKTPYLRSVDEGINSTKMIMSNFIIALLPLIIFSFIIYGILPFAKGSISEIYPTAKFYGLIKPLINIIVGITSSVVLESLYFFLFKGKRSFKECTNAARDSFAAIPGLILALLFPSNIPLYVIVFGCVFANIIFKMLFGGFGHNIFNPALIGYAFCVFAFGGIINDCMNAQGNMLSLTFFNGEIGIINASSTPLTGLKSIAVSNGKFLADYNTLKATYGSLWQLFLGIKNGNMGEISGLLCVAGYLYLVFTKVINWRTPLIYVATVFGLTWIVGIASGLKVTDIWFPTYNIVTGGLLFGGVYMLTEPVTTPKNQLGKIMFAVGAGVLTVLFRFVSSLPEGVGTAILFMCLFTPIIDKAAAKYKANAKTPKSILKIAFVFVLFALVALYTVYKSTNITSDIACTIGGVLNEK